MVTEKDRNVETNKLAHHALAIINNIKYRLDSLVGEFVARNICIYIYFLSIFPLCFHRRVDKVR